MDLLDTTFGTFLTTRLEMRLAGKASEYDRNTISIKSLATYLHEHVHLFQAIFTGYGHIQWDSHRQMTSYILSEWKKINNLTSNNIKLPLAHCNTTQKQLFLSQHVYETSKEQIKIGQAKFYMRNGSLTLKEAGLRLLSHDWRANPVVEICGKHVVLQTKDILEGHAHFIESSFVEHFCGEKAEIAWKREGLPSQYTNAYDWFIQECGESKHHYFPVICDLALQISWIPVIPQNENEWQSSNPSWRFVKLTRTLASHNISTIDERDNWCKSYKVFCSEILDICDYKSLDEIFEERIQAFSRKNDLMEIEKLMKKGIQLKKSKPWIGVNPVGDKNELYFLMRDFNTPYIVFEDGIGSFGDPSVSGGELLFELQFQALASQVFGDFSPRASANCSLECAFSKNKVNNGCNFQSTHSCTGLIKPNEGIPFPMSIASDGTLEGCSFEWLLNVMGLKIENIEINPNARFPPLK